MDQPFDRANIGFREKLVSQDLNRQASQFDRTIRYLLEHMLAGRSTNDAEGAVPRDAFVGTGMLLAPAAPAAMTVVVSPGLGFHHLPADVPSDIGVPDLMMVDDLAAYKPLVLGGAGASFAVPTAPTAPNTRIDIIEVRANRALVDSETRRQLNDATGAFDPHDYYKTLSWILDGLTGTVSAPANSTAAISYKVGVAANPGVAPSVSPGYVKLGEVLVGSGATSIAANKLVDRRRLLAHGGVVHGSARARVVHNAGSPTLTWSSVCAPPGVKIAAAPFSPAQRGAIKLYILGGEITNVGLSVQPIATTALVNTTSALVGVTSPMTSGVSYIQTVDSTLQTALAAATPSIAAAIGQKVVVVLAEPRMIIDSGAGTTDVNSTDGSLEDVEVSIAFDLAYH